MSPMRISAKSDYALRALIELAGHDHQATVEELATAQGIPARYLQSILTSLKQHGVLAHARHGDSGYYFAREPSEVTVADVVVAMDGPLVTVRGETPSSVTYSGSAIALRQVWLDAEVKLRAVLETVTVGSLVDNQRPAAWLPAAIDG